MQLVEHITATLAPHLGANTADAVARHLCAKHGLGTEDSVEGERREQLKETLRRGLVAFVGADQAAQIAAECLSQPGRA